MSMQISNGVKKAFFIFFVIFFVLSPILAFGVETEVHYPTVPHAPTPGPGTNFPQYVKYLFNLAIRIVGIIAFAVLVWAGFLYLTSAGDATKKAEAKEKVSGAFLGILVFLFSYLLLYTINPKLLELSTQEAEPTGGIYLKGGGEEYFINDTADNISYSGVNQIEFVSPRDSLLAVYIYGEKNFKGTEKMVENSVTVSFPSFHVKSVYFLWNLPGVYLCPTTTAPASSICPTRPLFTNLDLPDLSVTKPYFDDMTQSVQFVSPFQSVLFSDPGYEGKCAYSSSPENIPDLSASTTYGYNDPPLGTSTLSSLIASKNEGSHSIKFYDRYNCKGDSWTTSTLGKWIDLSATTSIRFSDFLPVYENILSFKFEGDGSGAVLLNTDKNATGTCEFFEKPKGEINCVPNLVGEPVYESEPEPPAPGNQTKKVRAVLILKNQR